MTPANQIGRAEASLNRALADFEASSNADTREFFLLKDGVIRVYDEAGNVTETHEHAGDFKEP